MRAPTASCKLTYRSSPYSRENPGDGNPGDDVYAASGKPSQASSGKSENRLCTQSSGTLQLEGLVVQNQILSVLRLVGMSYAFMF